MSKMDDMFGNLGKPLEADKKPETQDAQIIVIDELKDSEENKEQSCIDMIQFATSFTSETVSDVNQFARDSNIDHAVRHAKIKELRQFLQAMEIDMCQEGFV